MKKRKVKSREFICGDCGFGCATGKEFSDHAHECSVNPVTWENAPVVEESK